MEVGLEIQAARFEKASRYLLAFSALDAENTKRYFVSEESAFSFAPEWDFEGVRFEFGMGSFEFTIAVYRDPGSLARSPRLLLEKAAPLCSATVSMQVHDHGDLCFRKHLRVLPLMESSTDTDAANGAWKRAGTLTVALGLPSPTYAPLVFIGQLPGGVEGRIHLTEAERLLRFRGMNKEKRGVVKDLACRLECMRKALSAIDKQRMELEAQRGAELEVNSSHERQLRHATEPQLTDLDFELMLSLKGGVERAVWLVLNSESRWRRVRDRLLQQFEEFQRLQPEVGRVRELDEYITALEATHEEQQVVIEAARTQHKEVTRIREMASERKKMILRLEQGIAEAQSRSSAPAEARLALSRERATGDALREALAQLEITLRAGKPREEDCDDLFQMLQEKTERVLELAGMLEVRQEGMELGAPDTRLSSCRSASDEATVAITTLKLRHEAMTQRIELLEYECRESAVSLSRDVARLKVEFADREAKCARLESSLGVQSFA